MLQQKERQDKTNVSVLKLCHNGFKTISFDVKLYYTQFIRIGLNIYFMPTALRLTTEGNYLNANDGLLDNISKKMCFILIMVGDNTNIAETLLIIYHERRVSLKTKI